MKSGPDRAALPACLAVVGAMASYAGLSVAQSGAEPASAGTISYEEIVAKYADPDSRFVVLEGNDGINVHYKDRGSGPAVLLVHSSTGRAVKAFLDREIRSSATHQEEKHE